MIAFPCLQLDVGNSSAKWRLVDASGVLARGSFRHDGEPDLAGLPREPERIWIASVASEFTDSRMAEHLQARWPRARLWFARSEASSGGMVNSYREPVRMGVDRWLAMLAAWGEARERCCVVDAGSALTVDLVAADGRHEGGYIIPGPALMERALLLDTDRVRFADDAVYALSPGQSTAEAVRHGIALAQSGAVLLALRQAGQPAPRLVFCGGAGQTLRELLGGEGEWRPDLVFEGLERLAALHGQAE